MLAKYTPVEMVALGDWQSKSELPQEASMPTHYAGSRDLVSMRLKHLSLGLAYRLGEFDAWELATPEAITAAVDATKPEVQRAVSLDKHSLWDRPMSAAAAQRAFVFSRERAALTKEAQASSKRSSSAMPPSINGKVVTRFLRNGTRLCAQTSRWMHAMSARALVARRISALSSSGLVEHAAANTPPRPA